MSRSGGFRRDGVQLQCGSSFALGCTFTQPGPSLKLWTVSPRLWLLPCVSLLRWPLGSGFFKPPWPGFSFWALSSLSISLSRQRCTFCWLQPAPRSGLWYWRRQARLWPLSHIPVRPYEILKTKQLGQGWASCCERSNDDDDNNNSEGLLGTYYVQIILLNTT